MISKEYQALNKELHESNPGYGAGGGKWKDWVEQVILIYRPDTILDYGCGKGSLKKELNTEILEYDPAIVGKDIPPDNVDLVVCTDVIEHVEPEFLDEVLAHIKRISKAAFIVIACRKGNKTLPDGRPAHLIVESPDWWKKKMQQHGKWTTMERKEGKHLIGVLE
jgi:2-polyprenyl-3-methyl-5-hydroxy-6-metoxy-1,4-benzoquinol methylase